jgi:hypothetical protein
MLASKPDGCEDKLTGHWQQVCSDLAVEIANCFMAVFASKEVTE